MSLNKNFFMKSTIRFILAFLIINLTFVREGAALESGDFATPLFLQSFSVAGEENMPRGLTFSNDGTKMFVIGEQNGNGVLLVVLRMIYMNILYQLPLIYRQLLM